ncbi:TonB-dependent receptor plug domain-containing protein [Polaribacter marinus]|uniref:TonB-dependent receptor plug domain-containing protein n=1 Tax=Polaribacter marinus TaxID=2916838 RepID=UPI0030840A96
MLVLLGALLFCFNINAQSKKITIKVKDANNKPVAGAIILLDNVKQKRWTNSKGVFKTTLKSDPKEISAFHPNIGIKKIKYNGSENITLKIKEGTDQPILTESSNLKKGDSGQFDNIYDYLRGKFPGVNISSDDVISIRGYGSINGNMTPLFVVNGSNVSQETFGQIIPNDIKSVTILKGPETARYGVRGSNGVIVITTK